MPGKSTPNSEARFKRVLSRNPDKNEVIHTSDLVVSGASLNEYNVLETIGVGAFSVVRRVTRMVDGKEQSFALKILKKSMLAKQKTAAGRSALDDVRREIALMKKFNHPNLTRLYEVIDDPNNHIMFLVLEFISGGQLMDRVSDSRYQSTNFPSGLVPELTVRKYSRDILHGLMFLHHQQIAHRDLKPENILLSSRGICKLADFGLSFFLGDAEGMPSHQVCQSPFLHLSEAQGTYHFFAPECVDISEDGYDGLKADIWALGITLVCCVTGELPYFHESVPGLFNLIRRPYTGTELIHRAKLKREEKVSKEFLSFLDCLLLKDPRNRSSSAQSLSHSWITGNDRNSIGQEVQAEEISVSKDEVDHALAPFRVRNISTFIGIKMAVKSMKFRARRRIKFTADFHATVEKGLVKDAQKMLQSTIVEKSHLLNTAPPSDPQGRTPLHRAALLNSPEMLIMLMEEGCFPCAEASNGDTALHIAAEAGRAQNCSILLDHGVRQFNKRSVDGKSANDLALDEETKSVLRSTTDLSGIGKVMKHKKNRHSVKNPLHANRSYSIEKMATQSGLSEWIEVQSFERSRLCPCFPRSRWTQKFMQCDGLGKMVLMDARQDKSMRMTVSGTETVYMNKVNVQATTSSRVLERPPCVLQVTKGNKFTSRTKQFTLQLLVEDKDHNQSFLLLAFPCQNVQELCMEVVLKDIQGGGERRSDVVNRSIETIVS